MGSGAEAVSGSVTEVNFKWLFSLNQCFSNRVPQMGVRCSERRKFLMMEIFIGGLKLVCTN